MLTTTLEHRFVRSVPGDPDPGILYVSMDFGMVIHRCCCGCGEKIVTPLTPTDWKITYDGDSVSLTPSVGNWQLPCRSHYFIRQGRVIEAGPWSDAMVAAEHRRDKEAKKSFYAEQSERERAKEGGVNETTPVPYRSRNWWAALVDWFSSKRLRK